MIDSLNKSGYDSNNLKHHLIICGDLFDRGPKSKEVYEYVRKLYDEGKCIVLKGNHDAMFIDYMKGKDNWFNYIHNGAKNTFKSFYGMYIQEYIMYNKHLNYITLEEAEFEKAWFEYEDAVRNKIIEEYKDIIEWFSSLPDYYETENYIFTHASIDTEVSDWHHPKLERYGLKGWEAAHWDDGSFFGKDIKNTNKTIVCGHFNTDGIREKYNIEYDGTNPILVRDDGRIIMIDTCTPITKRFNVLKLYNEDL